MADIVVLESDWQRVIRTMTRAERAGLRGEIRTNLRDAAKLVRPSVAAGVPVASGELLRSLKVRSIRRSRRWIGVHLVFTGVRHALPQEYGFEVLGGRFPGRSFARSGFRSSVAAARELIASRFREALRWRLGQADED
jgi:hypothetical protein